MRDREIVINFDPNMIEHRYEQSVVYIFSKYHEKIGFPTVLNIKPSFPDATAINDKGERVEIEFEYRSTGFLEHLDMIEGEKKYVCICWEDDDKHTKIPVDVEIIELKDKVQFEKPKSVGIVPKTVRHAIIPFDLDLGGDLHRFRDECVFRTGKGKDLEMDSIVVLKRKNHFIAEFRVIRILEIQEPRNEKEKEEYRKMFDYPIRKTGEYHNALEYWEKSGSWLPIHIFYDNFRVYYPPVNASDYLKGKRKKMIRGMEYINNSNLKRIRGLAK